MAAIEQKENVVFWAPDLTGIQAGLEERRQSFYPTWNDPPTSLRMITIFLPSKKKTAVRIRQVPAEAPMIQTACEQYTQKTGRKLEYKGERLGARMVGGVEVDFITKRIHASEQTIAQLKEQQENNCSSCHEP